MELGAFGDALAFAGARDDTKLTEEARERDAQVRLRVQLVAVATAVQLSAP